MAKEGFSGQWIEICRVGEFVEAGGKRVVIDDAFLNQAIANFNAGHHEPPIVVGHPELDAPAFGWTEELRRNGDRLEARFADTNDEFEKLVKEGAFRKRSSAFYLNPPTLKHVGFLGATAPAVKGLKNIHFAEGETATFENSFNLNEEIKMGLEDKDVEKVTEGVFEKIKNFFKLPDDAARATQPTAQFSETDVKAIVAEAVKDIKTEAVKEAKAELAEELKTRDETIQSLRDDVNNQSASRKRSQIVAFCERQGNGKITPAMKRAGIIEFMESLEVADAGEKEKAIALFSEGAEGVKTEVKFSRSEWFQNFVEGLPQFVEFGEKFGALTVSGDATMEMVNPGEVSKLRESMGVKTEAGGEK
jgi:hypothetical protein